MSLVEFVSPRFMSVVFDRSILNLDFETLFNFWVVTLIDKVACKLRGTLKIAICVIFVLEHAGSAYSLTVVAQEKP